MKKICKFIVLVIIIAAFLTLESCKYNKPQSYFRGTVIAQLNVNDSLYIFNESDSFFTACLTGEPSSWKLAPRDHLDISAKAAVDSDGTLKIIAGNGTSEEYPLKDFDKGDRIVVTAAFIAIALLFLLIYRYREKSKNIKKPNLST